MDRGDELFFTAHGGKSKKIESSNGAGLGRLGIFNRGVIFGWIRGEDKIVMLQFVGHDFPAAFADGVISGGIDIFGRDDACFFEVAEMLRDCRCRQ